MSITPYHGPFGRQQDTIFDPFCTPQPLNHFPMIPSPWNMHGPLQIPPTLGFSPRNRIEYEETPDTHLFRVQVSGSEDARVCVEDGRVLHISTRGSDKKEERTDERGFYRVERSCGEFVSKFKLPEDAKVEQLTSFVKDGMLTVVVPREKLKAAASFYGHRNY